MTLLDDASQAGSNHLSHQAFTTAPKYSDENECRRFPRFSPNQSSHERCEDLYDVEIVATSVGRGGVEEFEHLVGRLNNYDSS